MVINSTALWLIAGAVLCLLEFSVPTAFVEFTMGLSAFAVAAVSLIVPSTSIQIALWMVLSVTSVIATRRLLPNRSVRTIEDAKEAETLVEILPGQAGRVLCEGISWQARLDEGFTGSVAAQQRVIVIRREGNTLIVVPEAFLSHS